ncbi:hypothetical protein Q7P37_006606 [Cladosporium fusiforme]
MESYSSFGGADQQYHFTTAMGDLTPTFGNNNSNTGSPDLEIEEFVDAPEHQLELGLGLDLPMQDIAFEHVNHTNGEFTGPSHPFSPSAHNGQSINQSNHLLEANPKADNEQSHMPGSQRTKNQSRYDPTTEAKEKISVNKSCGAEAYAAAYQAVINKPSHSSQSQGQHSNGCNGARGASTPPHPSSNPVPKANSGSCTGSQNGAHAKDTAEEKIWLGPDDLRDISRPFKNEKSWHDKVALLHPPSHLPSHRYWIGVLNRGLNARSANKESHFTWMKGNRLTTVKTVRKIYERTVMLAGGILIMGGERPDDNDRMEELDLFNDKIVLFRVAEPETPEAEGREITKGLVTDEMGEVIELDD